MNRLELYPLGLWKMSGAEFEGSNYGLYYELLRNMVLRSVCDLKTPLIFLIFPYIFDRPHKISSVKM
jgi:hypothetical protein